MRSADISVRIGEIYALPLFELATDAKCIETVEQDLASLMALLEAEPKLDRFLSSPQFTTEDKSTLVTKLLGERVHELTLRFLGVVIRHGRAPFIADIVAAFQQHFGDLVGRTKVEVTVAKALKPAEEKALSNDLAKALDGEVELDFVFDPAILGGTIMRYEGQMVDNSVRGRLRQAIGTIMHQRKG